MTWPTRSGNDWRSTTRLRQDSRRPRRRQTSDHLRGSANVERRGRHLLAKLEAATGIPAVILESPRGLADATLGALPDWEACRSRGASRQGAGFFAQMDDRSEFCRLRPSHRNRSGSRADGAGEARERRCARFRCVADPALAAEKLAAGARQTGDSAWLAEARVLSMRGRHRGRTSCRGHPAGCIPPKFFGPCGLSSSAIRTPS